MAYSIQSHEVQEEYRGLTTLEAHERQTKFGLNVQPTASPKKWLSRVWDIVSEPMMLLLVATSVVYFFVGDLLQGTVIFASIIPITIIEFLQQKRTDTALAALRTLRVEICSVYRDGVARQLPTGELVPGDIVYVTAGDKVPADGVVTFTPGILVDEAILTGESAPVEKAQYSSGDMQTVRHQLFQSTMVVQGEARFLVTATGTNTEYGKMGKLLQAIEIKTTPLQTRIEHLVKRLAIAAIIIATLIGLILAFEYSLIHGLLAALTVAIAIIPEEFPIVFSVFLIMGVMRMTRRQAVVRQMALVETLGSATVICTDKTGTLTEGKLQVASLYYQQKVFAADDLGQAQQCKPLIFAALLAVEQVAVDPIEVEVQRLASAVGVQPDYIFKTYVMRHDSSFSAVTKLVQHVWEDERGNVAQYVAGAPEAVLSRSAASAEEKRRAEEAYEDFARQGYRVIGVGQKVLRKDESFVEAGWDLMGLVAMVDPPRTGVAESVAEAYKAGIKVVMITGDNELTAMHLAKRVGIRMPRPVVRGDDLDKLTPEALQEVVKMTTVYSRVRPEQKYNIVEALQRNGEVVAMTGDGVNDAPALKKADIGIAMGARGTEVARAAAGMILLDDNFTTIIHAVEEGRRIYDNLRRAFVFLFSLHIPIVGLAVVPLFFRQDLFFVPLQIIFLELFGDPASVVGFERDALRAGAMTSPPRPVHEPLISRRLFGVIALYGLSIFSITLTTHLAVDFITGSFEFARTIAFVVLIFAQIALVLFSRDWQLVKSNSILLTISALTLFFLTLIVFVHPLTHLFSFVPVTALEYLVAAAGATAAMFVVSRIGRRLASV